MPASPSSSAQSARVAVAARLRDLRRGAGLTVTELATLCGWHHSKTSRIENARTAPSARDIQHWCRSCGRPEEAADLVVRSMNAESMYSEWRHQVQELSKLQNSWPKVFAETRLFRIYSSTLVPGLLQTHGYAGGLLGTIARFRGYPEAGDEAAKARVDRSQIIHAPGRRIVLVVEESALHHRMAGTDAMAAQLGHLLTAGTLPAVSLGVIPQTVEPRTVWPLETFHVYDDRFVSVELLSAEVNITQPSEVELYLKAFEQLRHMAVYGADARTLITHALAALR
ncbi:helix-turn-helix domain-containing protein [Streptomyces sp. NPDC017949]|uniref:helix-turn-helix domain-containing protein n=1 Tax=Streptomyces sp. NPDC017949 TaxID=3365020 RepID=UPI00379CBD1E